MFGLPDGLAACLSDVGRELPGVRVDGLAAEERGLRGKPAPDTVVRDLPELLDRDLR
jgi:hypothetical protein